MWVVDNSSGTVCGKCGLFFHAVCAMTAHRLAEGCFPSKFFDYRDDPRPPWHCTGCSGTQPPIDFTNVDTPTSLECRLPLLGHQTAPGIVFEELFCMHLSPQHARPLLCSWQQVSLTTARHGAEFRHLLQFANMFFPEVDERALISLTQQHNCRLLSLQSTGHSGCHWLSFLLFGQTDDGGIPVILLQAVHPALQRQGIGRWGLQLLYRQCAKVRDMTLHTQPGDLGFYTHMGFLPYQEVRYRFKAFGGTVWKRSHTLGAFLDLKLSEVVAARATMTTRAQLYRCRWLCPQHLAFMTLPGTYVCFVATMLHMLLSVPQLAAYFSMYETSPQSTGALIARCLAHLWQDSQDPDGSALVALIRARLQGDFGHAKARSKQGPKKELVEF
jgi:GNAT superfamily N-acetyltransferase